MHRHHLTPLCIALLLICWPLHSEGQQISVFFSPRGGCTAAICQRIDAATTSIDIAAYHFSSEPITASLAAARQRGVRIRLIMDAAAADKPYTTAGRLAKSGALVLVDRKHAIHHSKYMVIDNLTTVTGSFNFTPAAETRNAENLIIIRDATVAKQYAENWQQHAQHSEPRTW